MNPGHDTPKLAQAPTQSRNGLAAEQTVVQTAASVSMDGPVALEAQQPAQDLPKEFVAPQPKGAKKTGKTWEQIEAKCKDADGVINIHSAIEAVAGYETQADTLESLSECVYGGMFDPDEVIDLDREGAFAILEEIASDSLIKKLKAILPVEGTFTLAYPRDFEG